MNNSDEQISQESIERKCIDLAQQGLKEAFGMLVQMHQGVVYSSIVRRGINPDIAKELTQEVFLKAYLNIKSFRFQASFRTWLISIAVNHTTNYYHSRSYKELKKTVSCEVSHAEPAVADGYDVDALRSLQKIVFGLPAQLQEVMVLYAFEQQGYNEIAHILEVPVGTVRSRLHRARMIVREKYFEEEKEAA